MEYINKSLIDEVVRRKMDELNANLFGGTFSNEPPDPPPNPQSIIDAWNELNEKFPNPTPRLDFNNLDIRVSTQWETHIQIWFPPDWTQKIPYLGKWLKRKYRENKKNWRTYIMPRVFIHKETGTMFCHPVIAQKIKQVLEKRNDSRRHR